MAAGGILIFLVLARVLIERKVIVKPLSVEAVPAFPGYFTIHDDEKERKVWLGEPVMAWRIEKHTNKSEDETVSSVIPLIEDGVAASTCMGVQNPDKTVTIFNGASYASIEELQKNKYPTHRAKAASVG